MFTPIPVSLYNAGKHVCMIIVNDACEDRRTDITHFLSFKYSNELKLFFHALYVIDYVVLLVFVNISNGYYDMPLV